MSSPPPRIFSSLFCFCFLPDKNWACAPRSTPPGSAPVTHAHTVLSTDLKNRIFRKSNCNTELCVAGVRYQRQWKLPAFQSCIISIWRPTNHFRLTLILNVNRIPGKTSNKKYVILNKLWKFSHFNLDCVFVDNWMMGKYRFLLGPFRLCTKKASEVGTRTCYLTNGLTFQIFD